MVSVRSLGLSGISGYEVTVECFLSGGLPAFDVVGLPDTAVREARERVRAAVKTCGARFPVSRITVNLAPANQRKEGTVYDLPILLGLLTASEELPPCRRTPPFWGAEPHRRPAPGGGGAAHGPVRRPVRHPQALCPGPERRRGHAGRRCHLYPVENVAQLLAHLRARRPSRRRSGGSPPARRCPCRTFPRSWDRRT